MFTLIILAKIALALYITNAVFKSLAWLFTGTLFTAAALKAKKGPTKAEALQRLKEFEQSSAKFN